MQGYELNRNGELYVIRKPEIKTKIVDGTSLAVAAVLHMVPRGARDVLLLGKECKVVAVLAQALCERDIQVHCKHCCYSSEEDKCKLTAIIWIRSMLHLDD